jgi:hypothetical protein
MLKARTGTMLRPALYDPAAVFPRSPTYSTSRSDSPLEDDKSAAIPASFTGLSTPPHPVSLDECPILRAFALAIATTEPVDRLLFDINCEQQKYWRDPRVSKQLAWFKDAQFSIPQTYYSKLSPVGAQILNQGRPAQTSPRIQDADFLFGDSRDLERWVLNGTGDKLFLLRDQAWFHTRPRTSGSTMLRELQANARSELLVEVQRLEKEFQFNENSVERLEINEVISSWSIRDRSKPPLNLLSLKCTDDGTVPWPLAKHCNLLNQAAAFAASTAQSAFYATAGKQSMEVISKAVDLQSCMHFQIFGQAGAISSWHMDSIGPYTYITLEPNEIGQPADSVLKLWAFVRTDHLPADEREKVMLDFKRHGDDFHPNPAHIRVVSLIAGDTLIMPPGTIHAPLTITDCLFRGGMVMQKKEMRRSMRAWRFCTENGNCTNEEQPRQARSILDFFRNQLRADPAACGYAGEGSMAEFEEDWRKIASDSLVCKCKGSCNKRRCGCYISTQRCGSKCHSGAAKCDNPYGCEASVL